MKVISCLVILAFTAQALAQPAPPPATRTVIVLPIDGDADETFRKGLTGAIEKIAKTDTTATVKQSGTTFGETAAAVGCDPLLPPCAETVRTTLGMDEVVYGTATNTADGKITVVVRKKVKDRDPEEVTTTLEATDPPDKIEPVVKPLVGGTEQPAVTCPDNATPGPDGKCPTVKPRKPVNTTRVLTIAGMAAGGFLVLGGLAMWSSANGLQGEIDDAPTPMDSGDFSALEAKEDKASSRAWTGNLLVLGGLALGGYSFYRFRKTGKATDASTTITPAPVPGGGAGVVIRIVR